MITPTGATLLTQFQRQGWTCVTLSFVADEPKGKYSLLVERERPEYDVAEAWGDTALQAIRKVAKALKDQS